MVIVPSSRVRVAVIQAAPVMFDAQRSLQKLADLTADAAKQGAELVVFPEAFIAGYPKGHDFGVSVGIRTTPGRDEFRRLFESAIEVPGDATKFIGAVAKDQGIHLVVGVIEKDGGTLYCTALIFAPDGGLLGKHRKLMPTAMERVIWGTGDGSTLPVLATPIGKIGSVICWENYMPLLRTAMYAKQRVLFFCSYKWPQCGGHIACHRTTVAQLVLQAAQWRGESVEIVEWPGGEPKQIELDVTSEVFASVHKGRMTVPLGRQPELAVVAGLPWGSIATVHSAGDKLYRIVGPAVWQAARSRKALDGGFTLWTGSWEMFDLAPGMNTLDLVATDKTGAVITSRSEKVIHGNPATK